MQIYQYDENGVFINETEARIDARATAILGGTQYIIPARATIIAPPVVQSGWVPVFVNGAWSVVQDHRGETWWDAQGVPHVIVALGDPAADGLSNIKPAPPAPTKVELADYAATRRFQKEIAGVLWGDDLVIQTDRESQAKMLAEFVAINAAVRVDPSPWKFADNKFMALSNADMLSVCLAGRAHVAAAFATEETVQAEIAAGTITTTAEIDAAFT